jgi:O-antigen ligase
LHGGAQDVVRYGLTAGALLASALFLAPLAVAGPFPRLSALAFVPSAIGLLQATAQTSVAPVRTLEAALVAAGASAVFVSIRARAGTDLTAAGRRVAWVVVGTCLAQAMFAAWQWSSNPRSLFGRVSDFQTMPFGSYVNHNNFAGLAVMGALVSLGLAGGEIRKTGRLGPLGLGLAATSLLLALATLASGSRGGALALFIAVSFFGWSRFSRRKGRGQPAWSVGSWLLKVAGLVVLAGLMLWVMPETTRHRMVSFGGGSTAYRIEMARVAMAAWSTRPALGGGIGAFGDFATPFKRGYGDVRSDRAESDLVEWVAETGLLGVIAFVALFSVAARLAVSVDRTGAQRWLRGGAWAAAIGMLAHSLFDFGFRLPANALVFAALLGIATADAASNPPPGSVRSRWLTGLVASLLVGAGLAAYRGVGASRETQALGRATPEARLSALDGVLARHGYLDEARRARALSWMNLAYARGRYNETRLDRAERDLRVALLLRPQWGLAWADFGWVAFFRGDTAAADSRFEAAVRLDPTHVGIGTSRGQAFAWSGRVADAVQEVQRLRSANPAWSRTAARQLVASWTTDATLLASVP